MFIYLVVVQPFKEVKLRILETVSSVVVLVALIVIYFNHFVVEVRLLAVCYVLIGTVMVCSTGLGVYEFIRKAMSKKTISV